MILSPDERQLLEVVMRDLVHHYSLHIGAAACCESNTAALSRTLVEHTCSLLRGISQWADRRFMFDTLTVMGLPAGVVIYSIEATQGEVTQWTRHRSAGWTVN